MRARVSGSSIFGSSGSTLPEMQQAAGRETIAQTADQFVGALAFRRSHGSGVPFRRFEIVDRHESWLAAHREPHVAGDHVAIDLLAEFVEAPPIIVGKRFGDAWR